MNARIARKYVKDTVKEVIRQDLQDMDLAYSKGLMTREEYVKELKRLSAMIMTWICDKK